MEKKLNFASLEEAVRLAIKIMEVRKKDGNRKEGNGEFEKDRERDR